LANPEQCASCWVTKAGKSIGSMSTLGHIADREGLPSDWLNDGAKGFLYSRPPVTLWRDYPGLEVYLPSLDYLLAMKIAAGRDRDIEDVRALVQNLGLSEPKDVIDILRKYLPAPYLTVRIQYTVEDLFA
jgi:hypothetical protein